MSRCGLPLRRWRGSSVARLTLFPAAYDSRGRRRGGSPRRISIAPPNYLIFQYLRLGTSGPDRAVRNTPPWQCGRHTFRTFLSSYVAGSRPATTRRSGAQQRSIRSVVEFGSTSSRPPARQHRSRDSEGPPVVCPSRDLSEDARWHLLAGLRRGIRCVEQTLTATRIAAARNHPTIEALLARSTDGHGARRLLGNPFAAGRSAQRR